MKLIRPVAVTDAILTSSSVAETDYTAYAGGTTYALGDRVRVVSGDVHQVYESLQNANTGHTPASSPTWWLLVGATNRWKMFDDSVQAQTTNADSIAVVLTSPSRIDSVAVLNISAASARVTMTDAAEGVVYDNTVNLTSDSGITDWWAYFFEPIIRTIDLALTDLPPYAGAALAITLTDTGATAACGECVVGLSRDIGTVEQGAKVGIQDYSVKEQDTFGNFTILERAFAKRANFTVWLASSLTDALQNLLSTYRATPIVYVGSDTYNSTIVYGFYKDFSVEIAYPNDSICTIEIEGLT